MSYFADSLKKLRLEQNLSMQALGDRACVSKSMICKIEADQVQPTIDVAARISRALNTTLSEMLYAPQSNSVVFLPRSQQSVWEDSQNVKRRNISPVFEGLKMEWLEVELPPQTFVQRCVPAHTKGIEKIFLVTSGVLSLTVNDETYVLHKGDSLYFDATVTHEYANKTDEAVNFFILVKY